VSGRRGPFNEVVDLHVPQVLIELLDSRQEAAVALRADFRIGVDVGLGTGGDGSLSAVARRLRVLDHTIVANPIGADPAQVFLRILCVDAAPGDVCALGGALENGLDLVLKTIDLPSLADDDPETPDVTLAPRCLQALADGTLVATFGLRLPGEPVLSRPGTAIDFGCLAPINVEPVTGGGRGTVGTVGTAGVLGTTALRTTGMVTVGTRTAVVR
jgi:hypothetical protein